MTTTRRRPATRRKPGASTEKESAVMELRNELSRTYRYEFGEEIRIDLPVAMTPVESGGVMVWDNRGTAHVVAPGWFHMMVVPINVILPSRAPTDAEIAAHVAKAMAAERRGDPL